MILVDDDDDAGIGAMLVVDAQLTNLAPVTITISTVVTRRTNRIESSQRHSDAD